MHLMAGCSQSKCGLRDADVGFHAAKNDLFPAGTSDFRSDACIGETVESHFIKRREQGGKESFYGRNDLSEGFPILYG